VLQFSSAQVQLEGPEADGLGGGHHGRTSMPSKAENSCAAVAPGTAGRTAGRKTSTSA
jgi:hypothetical protein